MSAIRYDASLSKYNVSDTGTFCTEGLRSSTPSSEKVQTACKLREPITEVFLGDPKIVYSFAPSKNVDSLAGSWQGAKTLTIWGYPSTRLGNIALQNVIRQHLTEHKACS